MNRKRHKHAEVIKAWADGAQIEFRTSFHIPGPGGGTCFTAWKSKSHDFWHAHNQYRIKPEPKPDVESYLVFRRRDGWIEFTQFIDDGNVMEVINIIRDGETGKIKSAEVFE